MKCADQKKSAAVISIDTYNFAFNQIVIAADRARVKVNGRIGGCCVLTAAIAAKKVTAGSGVPSQQCRRVAQGQAVTGRRNN